MNLDQRTSNAVLFVPGLGEDASTWEPQAAALADGLRTVRYDGRGTLANPSPAGPYRLSGLVADAVAALDDAGVARAHVVGASLGGVVAQQLALTHPERVASLVLISTWAAPDRALRALLSTWRWAAEQARSAADLLQVAWSSTHSPRAWNSGVVDDRISAVESRMARAGDRAWRTAREAFIWTTWAAQEHDARLSLPGVGVPALVVAGAEDRVLGPEHALELSALLPASTLVVVPHAGHLVFDDQPEAFDALLGGFLRDIRRPAARAA
jgi:pimeloyl-ACP methyl ester carboxylesterase